MKNKKRVWELEDRKRPVQKHWCCSLMLFLLTLHYSLQGRRERMSDSIIDSAQRCPMMSMLFFHPLQCSVEEIQTKVTECLLHSLLQLSFIHNGKTEDEILTANLLRSIANFKELEYKHMEIKACLCHSFFLSCSKSFPDRWFWLKYPPMLCICVCWISIIFCNWLDPF